MNILTINTEDWYNGNLSQNDKDWGRFEYRVDKLLIPMMDVLDRKNIKATFFCLGWLAEHHSDIIREIANRGHEIGCNGYWHLKPNMMKREEFIDDARRAKDILEKVSGQSVKVYRAPNFAINGIEAWFYDALKELGFEYDASAFGESPYKEREIIEFPVRKHSAIPFSGGGYFRLMPYFLIRKWGKESHYLMTYFHPRDFDVSQPRLDDLNIKERFVSYVGLKNAYSKWLRLMDDFEFVSIGQAVHVMKQ